MAIVELKNLLIGYAMAIGIGSLLYIPVALVVAILLALVRKVPINSYIKKAIVIGFVAGSAQGIAILKKDATKFKASKASADSSKKFMNRSLKGVYLGEPLKKIIESDPSWKVNDPGIGAASGNVDVDENAPIRIYSMMNVPKKKPLIQVYGDDKDLDRAKVLGILVSYLNYNKMGIEKTDFLNEMNEKWGPPSEHILGKEERYTWKDEAENLIGELTFFEGDFGPTMNLTLRPLIVPRPAKIEPGREKAKEILN